jgi:phosphoserine phosphatase
MFRPFSTPLKSVLLFALCLSVASAQPQGQHTIDPLPSWKEGKTKQSILAFVKKVTDKSNTEYVPPAERIAVFDNDGTLWSEQPMYFQLAFVLDRVKELAPKHPEWKENQPFKAAIEGDIMALSASGEKGLIELVMATHAGMTTGEFESIVKDWLGTAIHPRFNRPYTELVYQPMLELLAFLRANGFKTYIVSGGGVEFMRTFSEKVYGIPPEQVIGSRIKHKLEMRKTGPVLIRLLGVDFFDDGPDKPVGIFNIIGRVPIFAFGNSDGDQQMLQWTAARKSATFLGIVHHSDAKREYAYDRTSHIGRLDKAFDEGRERGWTIVDMKSDWKVIYSFEK